MRSILSALLILAPLTSFAWGQKGHDVVANIASRHLTPTTAAAVDSIFEGKSMVYWANWLDNASHTPTYDYTRTWHYKNIDEQYTFETAPLNPKGDIVIALNEQMTLLQDPTISGPTGKLSLKIIVHLFGDLHQPMHAGRYSDLGGNKHSVFFFKNETNLHKIWDTNIPESGHKWSYTEWTDQLDRASAADQKSIINGTVSSWCCESYEIAKDIYATTPIGYKVDYNYIAGWTPTVELQLLRGGLRLAHALNYIFDPAYRNSHTSPVDTK